MPRSFQKKKLGKNFVGIKELIEASEYVDAGVIEVSATLKEVPDGVDQYYESHERKFGCLPWRLQLQKGFDLARDRPDRDAGGVSLRCDFNEQSDWVAKASGVLSMEKWPEKIKGKTEGERKSELREIFSRKFNNFERCHRFMKRFSVPTKRSGMAADSLYLKNGQFNFRLEIIIHQVRKSHFPYYDFGKKTPMCNAVVKIIDAKDNIHRFHINKEFLSMHSDVLRSLFHNTSFVEGASGEAELRSVERGVFNEFLSIIYPSHRRPQIKYVRGLLEFARMYFVPMITAVCEQRLLVAEDAEMPIGERLKLADQYGLFHLKSCLMQKLDPRKMEDKFLEGLSQETLQMLIRKQKYIEQYEKTVNVKKSDAGNKAEAMEVDQTATSSSTQAARRTASTTNRHRGASHASSVLNNAEGASRSVRGNFARRGVGRR
ncbi:BTB domain-containing protein [Meloidogyne graminicola]|uniref:BTB domain-containing protein n=1 Tax=Meloidogyne graminicola TaxID=189291 RepID=A0A8S9ZIU1_9BILA|nr:BTB domain-containing protein [Meloidogyne graminicola]